jgi:hypothetical protein
MQKPVASLFRAAIASCALPAVQLAAAVILPNLPAGSRYQLIFVTADTRDATSTNIDDYNAFVKSEAALNYPSLPSDVTWHVVGSTATTDAMANAPTGYAVGNVPVYNTQGVEVSDGSGYGIYSTMSAAVPLLNPVEYDQYGNPSSAGGVNNLVWTGSGADGRADLDYQLGAPLSNGVVTGNPYSTYPWLGGGAPSAQVSDLSLPLYALSSPFTVVAGDANHDGVVNGLDIGLVSSYWLQSGSNVLGDANHDGVVNGLDIAFISSNWLATGSSGAVQVPEPQTIATAALGALALLACLIRRMA